MMRGAKLAAPNNLQLKKTCKSYAFKQFIHKY